MEDKLRKMSKEKSNLTEKEIEDKIKELKIEILKQPLKRKRVKKEIARLLTIKNQKSKAVSEQKKDEEKISAKAAKAGGKKK